MSSPPPPPKPVLVFDGTDPTGAAGLQGAVLTLAALGCMPLSVVTAVTCGDTRLVEQVYPLDPEWVADQARPLLEDMAVAAILIGDPGCADTVAAIAEIVADYAAPLVFAPGDLRDSPDPDESDDLIAASIELLLPQTTILVVDGTVAMRMVVAGDDDAEVESPRDAADLLLKCGAEHVLLGDSRDAALQNVDHLIGPQGILRTDLRPATGFRVGGALSVLAAAVAAGLADQPDCGAAVAAAHRHLAAALAGAVKLGMGVAHPDRMAGRGADRR